jgi:hypothetical protein
MKSLAHGLPMPSTLPSEWGRWHTDQMTDKATGPIARFVGVSLDCADPAGHPFCITTITPPDA